MDNTEEEEKSKSYILITSSVDQIKILSFGKAVELLLQHRYNLHHLSST